MATNDDLLFIAFSIGRTWFAKPVQAPIPNARAIWAVELLCRDIGSARLLCVADVVDAKRRLAERNDARVLILAGGVSLSEWTHARSQTWWVAEGPDVASSTRVIAALPSHAHDSGLRLLLCVSECTRYDISNLTVDAPKSDP